MAANPQSTTKRIVSITIGCLFALMFVPSFVSADDFLPENFTKQQLIEYEKQLNAILKTRRDEEKEFVAKVVLQVREGKIPSKLVSTSFQWVREKRPNTSYPFLYFEKVLRLQAKAIKIDNQIPAFDFSIYKSHGQRIASQNGSAGQKTKTRRKSFFTAGSRR
ncbi:MAG: hypothetical protein AB8B55_12330 [Mariniblastus sp.]